jgi:protein TonB
MSNQAAPAPKKKGYQDEIHKPFGVLLASKPPKQAGRATSSVIALVFHALVGGAMVWATYTVAVDAQEDEVYVELTPETFVPPPPPPPPPPSVDVPQVEQVKGFQTLSIPTVIPPDIPPPASSFAFRASDFTGEGVRGGVAAGRSAAANDSVAPVSRDTPSFTPHTVRPELTNMEDVQRALVREYPPMLRDAQIGGSVEVWLFIDTDGNVDNVKIQKPSGYPMLDQAALNVANTMKFTPAYNRDQKVPVWVSIPITFRVG